MLTQLARVSEARHIELDEIAMTVTPQFSQEGSILADTVKSRLLSIDTALEITTSASREEVSKLVATAERMCFMMDAVREPHEVRTRVTVNGDVLAS
jgi:organic hydroperoxide reductase OsmC/OhrA